jgi:hypothetical protein
MTRRGLLRRLMYRKLDIPLNARRAIGFRTMTQLLRDLQAFSQEHDQCGELDGGVEGERVWMTCTCGASIVRLVYDPPSLDVMTNPAQ